MPRRPSKPCAAAGCRVLIAGAERFCAAHAKSRRRAEDERRGSAHQRGYTSAWTVARGHYLRAHPLCRHCVVDGRVVEATIVDHIVPHRLKDAIDSGDVQAIAAARALFWDSSNWQSLCKHHHDVKTATEDGGFGRHGGWGGSKA